MQTQSTPSRLIGSLLLALPVFAADAQFGGGTETVTVGPASDSTCQYNTLQQAIDEIACQGPVACSRLQIRLSEDYVHGGAPITLDKSVDLSGGWSACDGNLNTFARTVVTLGGGQKGPLLTLDPQTGTVNSVFSQLTLQGNPSIEADRGGVVSLEPGGSVLRLEKSVIEFGKAIYGGGIGLRGSDSSLRLSDTVLRYNSARIGGGGLYCDQGGSVSFINGDIMDNDAGITGGGVMLSTGCELTGRAAGEIRRIISNATRTTQNSLGAGLYAVGATVQLGAINSRTIIQGNHTPWSLPFVDYNGGINRGGGVHLQDSTATFHNTWIRENIAADGGAISVHGDTQLLVDRFSGSCESGAAIKDWECSIIDFNQAAGGRDGDGDQGGRGAAVYATSSAMASPEVKINRTTVRFNRSTCPENSASGAGECDREGLASNSIFWGDLQDDVGMSFAGNLIQGNYAGDDDNFGYEGLVEGLGSLIENTIVANETDWRVSQLGDSASVVGNIIVGNTADFLGGLDSGQSVVSCNLSNFADEMNAKAGSAPIANRDLDPFFLDPNNADPLQADYRISSPNSPAIDRCDKLFNDLLTYDIAGNPRPLDMPAVTSGPGTRDVGAFELLPEGFVNETVDLSLEMAVAGPVQVEAGSTHRVSMVVRNLGANTVPEPELRIAIAGDATLVGLSSPTDDFTGNDWDCSAAALACTATRSISPGGALRAVTATIRHNTIGTNSVTALVEDTDVDDITFLNNSDQVFVNLVGDDDVIFSDSFE